MEIQGRSPLCGIFTNYKKPENVQMKEKIQIQGRRTTLFKIDDDFVNIIYHSPN